MWPFGRLLGASFKYYVYLKPPKEKNHVVLKYGVLFTWDEDKIRRKIRKLTLFETREERDIASDAVDDIPVSLYVENSK